MIMRKNDRLKKKNTFSLCPPAKKLLHLGLVLIALPLFWVILELERYPTLSLVAQARFGYMLEHILAAATLLLAGTYLVERCAHMLHKDNR